MLITDKYLLINVSILVIDSDLCFYMSCAPASGNRKKITLDFLMFFNNLIFGYSTSICKGALIFKRIIVTRYAHMPKSQPLAIKGLIYYPLIISLVTIFIKSNSLGFIMFNDGLYW